MSVQETESGRVDGPAEALLGDDDDDHGAVLATEANALLRASRLHRYSFCVQMGGGTGQGAEGGGVRVLLRFLRAQTVFLKQHRAWQRKHIGGGVRQKGELRALAPT